jgi:hypothetical protein
VLSNLKADYDFESEILAELEVTLFEVSAPKTISGDFMPDEKTLLQFRVNNKFIQSFECSDNLTAFL